MDGPYQFYRIVSVREVNIHPDFFMTWDTLVYDYAIVRTTEDIKFDHGANAACLPSINDASIADGKYPPKSSFPIYFEFSTFFLA